MARVTIPSLPKPRNFLYLISLRSGTELVLLSVLINKVSGVYGLLALFTGYALSPVQLSMYIYSIIALVVTVLLAQRMKRSSPGSTSSYTYSHLSQSSTSSRGTPNLNAPSSSSPTSPSTSPFAALAFAYLYAIDSIINALYTALFGFAWFSVLASHTDSSLGGASGSIDDTSGFTNPENSNVSEVEVIAAPEPGLKSGQSAAVVGMSTADRATHGGGAPGSVSDALLQPGSFMSLSIVCALWVVRVYFVIIVLAYARQVLRAYIAATSTDYSNVAPASSTTALKTDLAENPFAEHREEGQGWKGKLGRMMLSVGPRYWLGPEQGADEEAWWKGVGQKFSGRKPGPVEAGVVERERRRRSGTGPPAPVELPRFVGSN